MESRLKSIYKLVGDKKSLDPKEIQSILNLQNEDLTAAPLFPGMKLNPVPAPATDGPEFRNDFKQKRKLLNEKV